MAKITSDGFEGKTLIQYRAEIERKYLDIDSKWNIQPASIDGSAIAINSEMYANLDDQIGLAYSACDPDAATGQALVNLAAISGVPRKIGTFAPATVSMYGIAGTIIPAGTRIRNSSTGTTWSVIKGVTLPSDAEVICDERGAKTAGVGELSVIANPVGGWQSVTNNSAAVLGKDDESIAELRTRRRNSVAKSGSNQVDNIYGEIASLDGITHLKVDENEKKTTNANGLEPNSIIVIVAGGDENEIASAIAAEKNPGCGMNEGNPKFNGEKNIDTATPRSDYTARNGKVISVGGSPFKATFFKPAAKPVYVLVKVKKTGTIDKTTLTENIKSCIIEYWNATLFTGESVLGFDKTGFDIGEDIPAGKLHTPVNKAIGAEGYVVDVTVGFSGTPTGSLASVAYHEIGTIAESQITVSIL